eukprot:gb/GECG01009482.1/.p1 GENE.gb/GECG01009482.1/~~gb/GECG01009482.1/.p1  ORF type:complete len:315 (+),score=34.40 gb/GECG01009482.1/:1-945(+)
MKKFSYSTRKQNISNVSLTLGRPVTSNSSTKVLFTAGGTCGKKMTTVSALTVHIQSVHKEVVRKVPNSIPGRDDLDVEVYGMEGVPEEVISEKANPGGKRLKTAPQTPHASIQPRPAIAPNSGAFAAPPGSAAYGAFGGAAPYPQLPQHQPGAPGGPPVNGTAPPQPPPGMPPPPPGNFPSAQLQQATVPAQTQPQQASMNTINPISSPGPMGNGTGSGLSAGSGGYTSLSAYASGISGVSSHTTPTVAVEGPSASGGSTKKNVLVYDEENQSPEEKRAQLPRYRYGEQELTQEWEQLSQNIQNRLAQYISSSS